MEKESFMLMEGIDKLIRFINYVRENINPDLAFSQLYLLTLVAKHQGITQREIADKTALPQGSISRNLKILSKYNVKSAKGIEQKGYDLVELRQDMFDRRVTEVRLTKHGEEIVREMLKVMQEGRGE